MKIFRITLAALCLMALAHFVSPRRAEAGCVAYQTFVGNGPICVMYSPDPPAGARLCTGAPAYNEINIYSGANATGYCVTLTSWSDGRAGSTEPNAVNDHWYNPYPIAWITVGSGASNQGYIYQGAAPNFGQGWYLSPGWNGSVANYGIHAVMARGY